MPFQLSHSTDDREDSPAQRRTGIDILLVGDEIDPQVLELLQGIDQVPGGPGKPIKPPHQDHIEPSLPGIIHQIIERRSAVCGATDPVVGVLLVPYSGFHAFRHSGASIMENSGVPIGSIQRILGHENRSTTEIYLHSLGESERKAILTYENARKPNSHMDSHTDTVTT